jgi:hypothetical protein
MGAIEGFTETKAAQAELLVMGQCALLIILAKFLQCSITPKGIHHQDKAI